MRKNGLYLRLSIADGDLGKDNKDESNSIDNQRTLLVNFVQDRDDLSDEYIEWENRYDYCKRFFTIWQRLYWCRRLSGASTSNTGNPFYLIKQ